MNLFDMRTVISSYAISSAISMLVMGGLWMQNRRRSPALAFWLADFCMQFAGVLLIALRGILPDLFTVVVSNLLIVGGTLLLLIGLERYTGKPGPQWFNYLYLGAFSLVHLYFVYIHNSLQVRTINSSLGILVMCAQCAWLLLRRVDPADRPWTRAVGRVFSVFSLVALTRIIVDLVKPIGNDLFSSGLYDTLGVLTYQMLYIGLTFGLFLMVNRRLFTALENDITQRKIAEAALSVSEEKFSVAFHNSPDMIVLSSLPEGKIIDANEAFTRIAGFTREESLGRTTIDLNLWVSLERRNEFLGQLQQEQRALNFEAVFRKKNAELFTGLISGELIQLQGQVAVLSVIHDITERKKAEEEQKYISIHDALTGLYNRGFFMLEMERLERGRAFPVSIVMADVDELKDVNDQFGHAAGDAVLTRVARVLTAAFRAEDVVARIGGDEFAVLLPGTEAAAAEVALQRVRQMIRENYTAHPGKLIGLSVGVSTAVHPGSLSALLQAADEDMYRKKRGQEE